MPANLKEQLLIPLINGVIYAAITPAFFLFAMKFPLEKGKLSKRIGLYFGAAWVFIGVHAFLRLIIFPIQQSNGVFAKYVTWVAFERAFVYFSVDDIFSTCVPAIALAHAVLYYRKAKEKEVRTLNLQAALARAQLQALKGQIHPHFLFNTMHSISALMHLDVPAADTMICRLSHLLRSTLEASTLQETCLKNELDLLECYLKIEEARFQDRMKVIFDIEPDVLEAKVPHLLLQPIVENALRHGISRRVADGELTIMAERMGSHLRISVADNGPGFTDVGTAALKNSGLGLKITAERLINLYGDEQKLQIGRSPSGGVEVKIEIPLKLGSVSNQTENRTAANQWSPAANIPE